MVCTTRTALSVPPNAGSWLDPAGTESSKFVPVMENPPLPTGFTNVHRLVFSVELLKLSVTGGPAPRRDTVYPSTSNIQTLTHNNRLASGDAHLNLTNNV